jgi:hypothetical protein
MLKKGVNLIQMLTKKPMTLLILCSIFCLFVHQANSQISPGNMEAKMDDPIYTTYAADLSRSEYMVDEAYHLNFYSPDSPIKFETDSAGEMGIVWKIEKQFISSIRDMYRKPVILKSYADLVQMEYQPFTTIKVIETFLVYSSRACVWDIEISNISQKKEAITLYPFFNMPQKDIADVKLLKSKKGVLFNHMEPPENWFSTPQPGYCERLANLFIMSIRPDNWGSYPKGINDFFQQAGSSDLLHGMMEGTIRCFALQKTINLRAGEKIKIRLLRVVQPAIENRSSMERTNQKLFTLSMSNIIRQNEERYRSIPRLHIDNKDKELVYWGAFNLVRQMMMPPEGKASYNYYLFSREPTWNWGHEGQVFHESLSMLTYAYMNPQSAMDSQRIFIERQRNNGFIPYRIGPYITKTFPVEGEDTTSAPFFSWTNWEVYQLSKDRKFLQEAFNSGSAFCRFLLKYRDKDGDGLLEWGGHAVLECVRDSYVAIWEEMGNDPAAPKRLEALDLSCMAVMEMKSLVKMAQELDMPDQADFWQKKANHMAELINKHMWDNWDGFYYNLDRETNRFTTTDGINLKRMEIIGFLPLWAGISSKKQAESLINHLTNPDKFWRRFGVPTLAADDSYYDPFVKRCCMWNGPVWLLWDYMVMHGLLNYDRVDLAKELADKVFNAAAFQLSNNHRFWESFSPDYTKLQSPKSYIWDCIIARMFIDLHEAEKRATK